MIISKLREYKQLPKGLAGVFLKLISLYLCIYLIARIVFYFWNRAQLRDLGFMQTIEAFVIGTRFDLAVAAPFCALILLSYVWLPRPFVRVSFYLISIAHLVLFLGNLIDIELINFTGRRFSTSSIYLLGEGRFTNFFTYGSLFILMFFLYGLYFYFGRRIVADPERMVLKQKMGATLGLLLVALIAARGGVQQKPLSFVNAKVINHPFAHQLVLNTPFNFIKSIGRRPVERVHFFAREQMLNQLNLRQPGLISREPHDVKGKPNVVIFMLESFSSEYVNPINTPFFTELSREGVLFNPAYANGRRSVEGIAAVLAGIPAFMEESFINSEFAANDFVGLGRLLKTKKYHTSFFHGAKNGSMRFDAFTQAAGFDHYFGKTEFNDDSQDDGAWGIFDGPFLKYACDQISKFRTPFATVIFTLTAHQPYHLPPDYEVRTNNPNLVGNHPIIPSIHYADSALRGFFECARREKWAQDTIFVLTADHTGPELSPDASFKSKFEVPLLFYAPDKKYLAGLNNSDTAQHIDILPTLTSLLEISMPIQNHLARSLYVNGPKVIGLYSDQKYELTGQVKDSEKQLKAIRQYFSEGLYDNRLYFPRGPGNSN